jgi:Ca-activated chloride channel homolog
MREKATGLASRSRRTWIVLSVIAVTAALALVATQFMRPVGRGAAASECSRLTVLAAPEIVPVLTIVAGFAQRDSSPDCPPFAIRAAESADAARTLGRPATEKPSVWVPDSSIWTKLAASRGIGLPSDTPSLAYSPVVLAVSRGTAQARGWPARPLRFSTVIGSDPTGNPVRIGLPDPEQSSIAIGSLLGIQETLRGRSDARGALTSQLRSTVRGQPRETQALLARVVAGDGAPTAVPSTEQAVWTHNLERTTADVVAAYPDGGATALDYPFVVLARDPATREAAERLRAAARKPEVRDALWSRGFRAPDTKAGPAAATGLGTDRSAVVVTTVPSFESVEVAIQTLAALNLDSRMLAVIDVSGSMNTVVQGANGATRLELVRRVAAQTLPLFPDSSELGLWVFATKLEGRADHREIVPLGPLTAPIGGAVRRTVLARALADLQPTHRDTGLYDTTLAAVREVRKNWRAGAVNSVVLLTDGKNEDSDGIDITQLLSTLGAEADPERPVPVITIAYGPGSDEKRPMKRGSPRSAGSPGARRSWRGIHCSSARSSWKQSANGSADRIAD